MTRQEHLNFCKQCLNRKFDPQKGIICSITSKVADFDRTCANFIQDEQVVISQSVSEEELPVTLMEISEDVKQKIRVHQDISFALIGGLLAAVVSAVIWAVITVTFEYQIAYMAIGVGLLVGFTVRYFGAGIDPIFGFIGACFSLFGCLLGNLLSQVGFFVSQSDPVGYFEVFALLDLGIIVEILIETFSVIDILFYAFAIYEGYRFAFRPLKKKFLRPDVAQNEFKPSYSKLRLPLAFASLLFISFIMYNVREAGTGYKTYYYESGAKKSEGDLINSKEQGKWMFYYESGLVSSLGFFKNGIMDSVWQWYDEENLVVRSGAYKAGMPHGEWINYYPGGNKMDSGAFISGRKQGEWVYYFENGTISKKGIYNRDLMDGHWRYFYENGKLSINGKYQDANQIGVWKFWYPNGNLKEVIEFISENESKILNSWDNEGKRLVVNGNGVYKSFYDDGAINQMGKVENGKKVGIWKFFYENGKKKEEGTFKDSQYIIINFWDEEGKNQVINGSGLYTIKELNGFTLETGEFKDGFKTGSWKTFYPGSDILMQEVNHQEGKMEGPFVLYFENGAIYTEGNMKNNENEGIWNWYFDSGIMESTVNYKNGKKEGPQTFWDEEGNKIKDELYSNGEYLSEQIFNL